MLSSAAWQHYDVPASPYFVLVDGSAERIIGAGSATTWEQIRGLLAQALGDAGIAASTRRGRTRASDRTGTSGRTSTSGQTRALRADEALRAAGIAPGHPSLYAHDTADNGAGNARDGISADRGSSACATADGGEAGDRAQRSGP